MNIVTATKSNNTITVLVNEDGSIKPIPVTSEHPKWTEILEAWTKQDFESLLDLMSMKKIVERFSNGDLIVSDSGVFYKEIQLVGVDVDRIMAFLRSGDPYQPIANYMVRKLKNPSKRAINEMYNFLEHKQMPLTPNGTILAYKGVLPDFFSVSSGKEPLLQGRRNEAGQIFNGVGETIEMSRADVDDDFRRGCSGGLHAGSLDYARDWARSHKGVIIVIEIDPPDVVSVPEDCQCKKLRCAKYKVIGLYNGPLPDTYTAEFSTPEGEDANGVESEECVDCGADPCRCDNCDWCGCHVDDCTCNECSECGMDRDACQCQHEKVCGANDNPSPEETCPCQTCESQTPTSLGEPTTTDNVVEVPRDENAEKGLNAEKETAREILGLDTKGNEIRQKFVAALCEQLGLKPEDITDHKHIVNDLCVDSLDMVEILMELEEAFNIEITDEEAERCQTVGDAIAALEKRLGVQKVEVSDTYQKVQEPPIPQDADAKTYAEGFELGLRNGVRRRKRLYVEGNPNALAYERGYCDGYRAGRKDYKQKS